VQRFRLMAPRNAFESTSEGQAWARQLREAQAAVVEAERRRDDLVRRAQDDGLSVRAIASAIGVDKSTVSHRYPRTAR
jgi:ketol-acid reductoisomerase